MSQYVHLQRVAKDIGWRKLWDHAMDHGIHVVKGIKNLLRMIAYSDHATKKCPLCDTTELNLQCLPEHFISEHTNSEGNWETQLNSLVTMDPSFYCHVLCFLFIPHYCTFCVHLVYAQAGQKTCLTCHRGDRIARKKDYNSLQLTCTDYRYYVQIRLT